MTDSIPISLVEMPEVAMRKILGKCDFLAIQCLRKTCHTLRNFIDDTKPKLSFNVIEIEGSLEKMSLEFYHKQNVLQLYPTGETIRITYEKIDGENTKIIWQRSDKNREQIIEKKSFLDFFSRDFGALLDYKLPVLNNLRICCEENGRRKIQEVLESSGTTPIKVHKLSIANATCQEDVLEVLPSTCPETLHHLEISGARRRLYTWDISKIVELEQWKNAKTLEMRMIPVEMAIQNYDHFEDGNVLVEKLTMEDVMKVKENFLNSSSTSKSIRFFFRCFPDQDRLIEFFGPPYRNIDDFRIAQTKAWFFCRADNHVLFVYCKRNFLVFGIRTLGDIPQGARVI